MKKYYLSQLDPKKIQDICKRSEVNTNSIFETVKTVLNEVKTNGNKAVKTYTQKFDGVLLDSFEVTKEEIDNSCRKIPNNIKEAFKIATKNIEKFHKEPKLEGKIIETSKGVLCFKRTKPIEKVGLYVPGGTAPLPSTVLMLGIPARIAGCKEIIMCTPPNKEGKVPDVILFAARLAGIKRIFKIGGAQAIASMGYGTKSVPKVYKIFGPGNQYVTAAKMLLSIDTEGTAMDMPAGPSEVLVIADKFARTDFVAADLLSQAEHGPDSQTILVCTDADKTDEILKELEKQLKVLPRKEIAKRALENSFALITENVSEAIEFSNRYAPEHLIINVKNAEKYADQIANAGSVFIGQYSCESAGDYASGTNHTLPTYGYAKSYSGISTSDFTKRITFQKLNREGIKNLGSVVEKMAEIEQLQAHKNAMTLRIKSLKND